MTKQVKQLDRVIIRFAGDSGDGMQLTGDRFTQESAAFGNDLLDPAELPRGDPRAAGHAPRRLVVPGPFRRPRHPHSRRRPRRAGRDEPRRPARQPRRPPARRHDHRRHPRLLRSQPDQGRIHRQPSRRRLARDVRRPPGRPDRHDGRGGQAVRPFAQGRRAGQEHVRPRAVVVDVRPADRVDHRLPREALRQGPRHPRRQHHGLPRRLELRRDHRDLRGEVRDQAGADEAGHLPQHHRKPRARLRPGRERGAGRGCRCSSVPTRSLPPPTSSTSSASTSPSASRRSRPRTRSPASARPWVRRSRVRSASPRRQAPASP